jgi:DNA-binding CsgD family transcriptional regulator
MLSRIIAQVEGVLDARDPEEAGARFFAAMAPLGPSYCQVRLYRRPGARLTSMNHFTAGGRVFVSAPPDWPTSEAGRYVCFEQNPLLTPIREGRTRYAFSDFAPKNDPGFAPYWDALGEAGIGEALCATSYGAGGVISSVHLGFERRVFDERDAMAVQLAELLLTERMLSLTRPVGEKPPVLTPRERDSLALVADGKTDWEISVILNVSQATARFHVDNARRKLGAVSRAQAVATLVNQRLI